MGVGGCASVGVSVGGGGEAVGVTPGVGEGVGLLVGSGCGVSLAAGVGVWAAQPASAKRTAANSAALLTRRPSHLPGLSNLTLSPSWLEPACRFASLICGQVSLYLSG
jgi:hypothetical protein